ncbi:MAG TPA: AI-2E family transporter [Ferruginibacter sp.]|jgi:predicted PurR-regulated permease PerM|nr:AI-2E family transporter [Ferruginibacter sp.]
MLFLLGSIAYLGRGIIVPIYFSILLAILLLPLANAIERLKIPRAFADLTAVLSAVIVIVLLIYFLSTQISSFVSDVPSIKKHLTEHYVTLRDWVSHKFNISFTQQTVFIRNTTKEITNSGGEYVGQTFSSLTETLIVIVLVTIYTFLILFYRHLIRRFILAVFIKEHLSRVEEVLAESKSMVKNYMLGLLTEMAIIATVNSIILLCLGIKYAIFLGIFIAILNLVPYIGIITGILFTVLVTLTTSSNANDILWIIISLGIVHIVDSNILMPRIVGSKVKINALMAITGVLFGGSLMGLAGVFLALPTLAILKIIFDRVDGLEPWGILLGDEVHVKRSKLSSRLKKATNKIIPEKE